MYNYKVAQLLLAACIPLILSFTPGKNKKGAASKSADTITYDFKASYSTNAAVPGKPEYAQKVLAVWKKFETKQIDALKPYYADTVTYEDASGYRYHGPVNGLLDFAREDVGDLDSMRFDISMWQSVHLKDRNEDWVYIWATERQYPQKGKADTVLIHEQWKIEHNKIPYFNRYVSRLPRYK